MSAGLAGVLAGALGGFGGAAAAPPPPPPGAHVGIVTPSQAKSSMLPLCGGDGSVYVYPRNYHDALMFAVNDVENFQLGIKIFFSSLAVADATGTIDFTPAYDAMSYRNVRFLMCIYEECGLNPCVSNDLNDVVIAMGKPLTHGFLLSFLNHMEFMYAHMLLPPVYDKVIALEAKYALLYTDGGKSFGCAMVRANMEVVVENGTFTYLDAFYVLAHEDGFGECLKADSLGCKRLRR
jgi:hypothetical protein